ncbi:hypothetical protein T439DRAFT_376746 [Meredithblackwellia eburnea MCA 4105]
MTRIATSTDRTNEFREALKSKQSKLSPTTSGSTPTVRVKFGKAKRAATLPPGAPLEDNWSKQAEQVATNLRSFSAFLVSIRRAYLDLGSSSNPNPNSHPPRSLDTSKGLQAWEGVKWLNDRERDEIDFGVKVALRRSVDRVRELEAAEKQRLLNESLRQKKATASALSRFLAPPVPPGPTQATLLASHRSLITHYLNTLLAKVSEHQRDQQEQRVARQLERSATLGGMGGGGGMGMEEFGRGMAEKARAGGLGKKENGNAAGGKAGGGGGLLNLMTGGGIPSSAKGKDSSTIGQVPSIYKPAPRLSSPPISSSGPEDDEEEDPSSLSSVLSAAQIQQFEAEESLLLQATQTDLASLKLAESSLLEIASLQSQLAIHLSQQGEMTDKLWEEALVVTGRVEEGNEQLKKARERNRESRVWLLIFLMMASGTLLFLDQF